MEGPLVGSRDGVDPTAPVADPVPREDGTWSDVYTLDEDAGALVHFDPATGTLTSTDLGGTPGRYARTADTLWVTLPAERSVAVLALGEDGPVHTGTFVVGPEPLGIAVNGDGSRLYVALSTADEVVELDGEGAVLRRWSVAGLPSWLALRPQADALYVGSATGGTLTWIDLATGDAEAVELPGTARLTDRDVPVTLNPRITGDLAVSSDGARLAVPMLMTDNDTELDPPTTDPGEVSNGYASTSAEVTRFNPTISVVTIGDDGAPVGYSAWHGLVTSRGAEGRVARSYFASVAFSPDGTAVAGAMEAASRLAVMSNEFLERDELTGFATAPTTIVNTGEGPNELVYTADGTLYVDTFIDRELYRWAGDGRMGLGQVSSDLVAGRAATLPPSPLDADVLAGRRLFYSATSATMVQAGAGVSCSTCHLNGRNDGLSWNLDVGYRQTPSLAGGIAATAPVTWTSGVESVSAEVRITSEGRMGGEGLTDEQVAQVAAFVESIRAPDVPNLDADDDAVDRGRDLFYRSDVGCAGCHSGSLYTDNAFWPLYDLDAVNTPSLRRVSATAPYLHDGRAATLRDVLELSRDGSMGDTSMLSDEEMADLEAFLKSI